MEGETQAVVLGSQTIKVLHPRMQWPPCCVTDYKPLIKVLGDRALGQIPNSRLSRLKQRTVPYSGLPNRTPAWQNYRCQITAPGEWICRASQPCTMPATGPHGIYNECCHIPRHSAPYFTVLGRHNFCNCIPLMCQLMHVIKKSMASKSPYHQWWT